MIATTYVSISKETSMIKQIKLDSTPIKRIYNRSALVYITYKQYNSLPKGNTEDIAQVVPVPGGFIVEVEYIGQANWPYMLNEYD